MNCALFGKKTVFQRPYLPTGEQILDDLNKNSAEDIAFQILKKDETPGEGQSNAENSDLYQKLKTYFKTRQRLKDLLDVLSEGESLLKDDKDGMKRLAQNLRQQAQEALNT